MTPHTPSQTHEWWKDKTDPAELSAYVRSYRSSQREKFASGWRRNVMLGVLAVSVPVLIRMLAERAGAPVMAAAELGWSVDFLEAQAFAYLAARSRRGLPLSFPETTGVPKPMPGGVLAPA